MTAPDVTGASALALGWPGIAMLAAGAFAITALLTGWLIPRLAERELGKAIRVDGPAHGAKAGTPTMGGLAMLAVIAPVGLGLALLSGAAEPALVALGMCAFAVLGIVDDLAGLARRSGSRELGVGLGARQMLLLQAFVGLVLGLALVALRGRAGLLEMLGTSAVIAFVVVGTVNGANFTDGLDGLAAGVCAIAFASFAAIIALGPEPPAALPAATIPGGRALAALAAATCGGCLGFLVHNRYPAKVFMGNVGSMSLGAGIALVAVASGTGWLLPIVCAVFVIEVASVIAQVAYFKATGGKRILRMAPIHHHYEAAGLSELQVVRRFWAIAAAAGAAGIAVAYLYAG